jgi:hypothetical protein
MAPNEKLTELSRAGVAVWPGGVRHVDDASPVCGFRAEQEKCSITART